MAVTDYLLLAAAVLLFAAQFAFTKVYGEKTRQNTTQTLVMTVIVSLIGAVTYLTVGGFSMRLTLPLLLASIAFAAVMIPYYLLGIQVLSLGSLAVYSMFMMLGGMLLPFLYGLLFLGESPTWGKGAGCALLTAAIYLQAMEQKKSDVRVGKTSRLFLWLCLAIFILNGLTGVIAKMYQEAVALPDEAGFTAASCVFTAVMGVALLLPRAVGDRAVCRREIKTALQPFLFLITAGIGLANHTGNFLLVKAAANLPASVQFPMVSGGVVVCSALVSALFFKEKISRREWLCMVAACLSTLLFAF